MKQKNFTIEAEISLEHPTEKVWKVLTDFSRYPEWNPFIRLAKGQLIKGRVLFLFLSIPGGVKSILFPKVLEVHEGKGFRWIGSLIFPGLFHGEHQFAIISEGKNKSRLIQKERFGGILTPCIGKFIGRGAKKGFDAMNDSIRERLKILPGLNENTRFRA